MLLYDTSSFLFYLHGNDLTILTVQEIRKKLTKKTNKQIEEHRQQDNTKDNHNENEVQSGRAPKTKIDKNIRKAEGKLRRKHELEGKTL